MKTCTQAREKTNLSSRPGLPLERFAGGKAKRNNRKNQTREVGMKVAAGSQWHRPHLFIGGETQRSKILNLTVKCSGSRAFGVIQARPSGTDAWEDIFFCLDSRSLDFAGSGLHRGKRYTIEGLLLGDSESSLWYTKNKRVFSVARVFMRKAQR
jgi:hypothetical protein